MVERYPDDATLLAMGSDEATGVEYIATGKSPYYLEYRRMLQRLLLAAGRANDFRVYQDGDWSIGVRGGRCVIHGVVLVFAGVTGVAMEGETQTWVWLDGEGVVQTGTGGLPGDRTGFLPLAKVTTGVSGITSVEDLRGEGLWLQVDLGTLGVTATAERINGALTGANASVTAAALNALTGGGASTADGQHRHLQVWQEADEEVYFYLYNDHGGTQANVGLVLSLPNKMMDDLVLHTNLSNGFLSQRYAGLTYNMVGVVTERYGHGGNLTGSQSGKLMGVVPVTGTVSGVFLSVGTNMQSSTGTDGVEAVVKVKGTVLTTTHPRLTSSAGAGFKSTAQGHGTAGVLKTDATIQVTRGDVLTVDLNRTAGGTVSVEAGDVTAWVVIRVKQPE